MAYQRHPIHEIEGIGPVLGAALAEQGFSKTEDLLSSSRYYLMTKLGKIPNFPLKKLDQFIAQSNLLQVEGLDGQLVEGLYAANRKSLTKFASGNPQTVVAELQKQVKKRLIPTAPDADDVLRWQKHALVVNYTGAVQGLLKDEQGKPVANAVIYVGTEEAISDESGKFWIPGVPYGYQTLIIRADGLKRRIKKIKVNPGVLPEYRITLIQGSDMPVTLDEAQGDALRFFHADDYIVFEDVNLQDLPNNTPLIFRQRYKDGSSKFISVYRQRKDNQIIVKRTRASKSEFKQKASVGDIFYWNNGTLSKASESVSALRSTVFFKPAAEKKGAV